MNFNDYRMSIDDEIRCIKMGDWGMLCILLVEVSIMLLPVVVIGAAIW